MNIKNQKGAAAVEFAIVLPVLVLILFGTIEFGLLLYNKQVITNAGREGARAGIVARTPRLPDGGAADGIFGIKDVVKQYCAGHLITFGTANDPATVISREGNTFGDNLTVTVTYNYGFLVLSNLGFGPVNLVAQSVMKME